MTPLFRDKKKDIMKNVVSLHQQAIKDKTTKNKEHD